MIRKQETSFIHIFTEVALTSSNHIKGYLNIATFRLDKIEVC